METMKTDVAKLETQLKQWGAKLEVLAAETGKKGAKVNAESKAEYQKRIAGLRVKFDEAQKKLAEFKSAGGGKWDNFKDDMETLWKDVENTFKGLTQKKSRKNQNYKEKTE